MTYKYAAYLSTGEIIECSNFKTIFQSARFRVRDDSAAVIFCNKETKQPIAAMAHIFGTTFIWKTDMLHHNICGLLYEMFNNDEYSKYCWDMAGLV